MTRPKEDRSTSSGPNRKTDRLLLPEGEERRMASAFDRVPDRRDPNLLNKWTWYPADVIPMWVADMDFRTPPPVLAALRKAVDQGVLGYELPSRALLETVAARMQ